MIFRQNCQHQLQGKTRKAAPQFSRQYLHVETDAEFVVFRVVNRMTDVCIFFLKQETALSNTSSAA